MLPEEPICAKCGKTINDCVCRCPYCGEIASCDCCIGPYAATGG